MSLLIKRLNRSGILPGRVCQPDPPVGTLSIPSMPQCFCLFNCCQVATQKILDEGDFQRITLINTDRNLYGPDQSSGTQPSLTSQEVKNVFFNPAKDGLQKAVCQRMQACWGRYYASWLASIGRLWLQHLFLRK